MFRVALFLAAILGAAAFAPVARVARSAALKMGFENEIGAQPPLGFWDPLGLLKVLATSIAHKRGFHRSCFFPANAKSTIVRMPTSLALSVSEWWKQSMVVLPC